MITFKTPFLLFLFLFISCSTFTETTAEEIIEQAIGVSGFNSTRYQIDFVFRDYHYSLQRDMDYYFYSRQRTQNQKTTLDIMTSKEKLKRFVNDSLIILQDSLRNVYSNSLN